MTRIASPAPAHEGPIRLDLEAQLVETPFLTNAVAVCRAALDAGGIVAIDGPPGTGKTTGARIIANVSRREPVIVRMTDRPAPLDMLRYIVGQVGKLDRFKPAVDDFLQHHRNPRGYQMQELIKALFTDWGGLLIIDELQYTAINSMQELVWLYEETYRSFGLVIAGHGVHEAVQKYPQLATRLMTVVEFAPLTGQVLLDTVRGLDHRFSSSGASVILRHDNAFSRGLLRNWIMTIRWLNKHGVTRTIRHADLDEVRKVLPASLDGNTTPPPSQPKRPGRTRSR